MNSEATSALAQVVCSDGHEGRHLDVDESVRRGRGERQGLRALGGVGDVGPIELVGGLDEGGVEFGGIAQWPEGPELDLSVGAAGPVLRDERLVHAVHQGILLRGELHLR